MAISLAVGVIAGCPVGVLLGALQPLRLFRWQPRLQPRTAAVVPLRAMAHPADARTGTGPGRSTCLSISLLALGADCCELAPTSYAYLVSGPGRGGSLLPGSPLAGEVSSADSSGCKAE